MILNKIIKNPANMSKKIPNWRKLENKIPDQIYVQSGLLFRRHFQKTRRHPQFESIKSRSLTQPASVRWRWPADPSRQPRHGRLGLRGVADALAARRALSAISFNSGRKPDYPVLHHKRSA